MEAAYMTTPCERNPPVQFFYPTGTPVYPTAIPISAADPRAYELIPHRVFVGGFQAATTELELRTFFEQFGHVREAKVIRSNEGTSKGYGFITFDTEEEAKQVMRNGSEAEGNKLELKGRKLNLGPAVRRLIHTPRYLADFAFAAPPLAASPYGAYTYAYPQSPVVLMQSPQMQPSFIYSPNTTSPSQFQFPSVEYLASQQHTAATATPHNSPRNGIVGTQPTGLSMTKGNPAIQHITNAQPLTPMTPSMSNARTAIVSHGTTYCGQPSGPSDMMHYSQIAPQMYFYAPGTYSATDGSGQPLAVSTPIGQSQAVMNTQSQNSMHPFYGDANVATWQNTAVEQHILEMQSSNGVRRSPIKDVTSLGGQFNQMAIQQQFDVKNSSHSSAGAQPKRY